MGILRRLALERSEALGEGSRFLPRREPTLREPLQEAIALLVVDRRR